MPQDPWRRAYMLSRQKPGAAPPPGPPAPPRGRRRPRWGCWVGAVLLLLLAAAATGLWLYRWWWLPRYRPRLPEVVKEAVPEPRASIDAAALDGGLGCELIQFADYLPFIDATRQWGVEWTLAQTGGGTGRLSAEGVRVYTQDGLILTYELELDQLYASEQWRDWQPTLRQAGLTPDLTYTALTGGEELPAGHSELELDGGRNARLRDSAVRGKYILHFEDGWLRRVVAAVDYTPAR